MNNALFMLPHFLFNLINFNLKLTMLLFETLTLFQGFGSVTFKPSDPETDPPENAFKFKLSNREIHQ